MYCYKTKLEQLYRIRNEISDFINLDSYKGMGVYEVYNQNQLDMVSLYFSLRRYPNFLSKEITITMP